MPSCTVPLQAADIATLTFDGDDSNVIGFYQYYSTVTLLLYQSCYEPMDSIKCRYQVESEFLLCICNGNVPECTYDAPLELVTPW